MTLAWHGELMQGAELFSIKLELLYEALSECRLLGWSGPRSTALLRKYGLWPAPRGNAAAGGRKLIWKSRTRLWKCCPDQGHALCKTCKVLPSDSQVLDSAAERQRAVEDENACSGRYGQYAFIRSFDITVTTLSVLDLTVLQASAS
jgi:hypothetical protein